MATGKEAKDARVKEEYTGYIRVGEAARMLEVSTQRINQLIAGKKLRFRDTPYGRVIEVESIKEYDENRKNFLWAGPQKELAAKRTGIS